MEDSASAAKTRRGRLENMDPAQLAAVGIEVVPVRPLLLLLLPQLNVSDPGPLQKTISLAAPK